MEIRQRGWHIQNIYVEGSDAEHNFEILVRIIISLILG